MPAVGLGFATALPSCDFETYSEAGYEFLDGRWRMPRGAVGQKPGLELVGTHNYVNHPSFRLLSSKYDLLDGVGRRTWLPHLPPPEPLFDHVARGGLLAAWNAPFEIEVWESYCVRVLGWPSVPLEQWRCTMAKARAHALPGSLDKAGDVLELVTRKDKAGKSLLDKFSKPRSPTKSDPRRSIVPVWTPADLTDRRNLLLKNEVEAALAVGANITERGFSGMQARASEGALSEMADSMRLLQYNDTDVATELEAAGRIPDLPKDELTYWGDDLRINRRGVMLDMVTVEACAKIIRAAQERYSEEIRRLTGGIEASEVSKLLSWLHTRGVHMDGLDEDQVESELKKPLPEDCVRVLQIRQLTASSSVKKIFAMKSSVCADGRLRNLYTFHGARTGRPTGSGVQATNLPKAGPDVYQCGHDARGKPMGDGGCGRYHGAHTFTCPHCGKFTLRPPKTAREWTPAAMVEAIEVLKTGDLDVVERAFGNALLTIAGCLRGLFIAAPGHTFVSSDYTAIEGVVVAGIAGEQWRIDAYASGSPMYLLSAERMFGVTVAEMEAYAKVNGHHHPLRQKGKGGELGLGFGGWIQALRQFDVEGSDDDLKDLVLRWRAASPNIEWLWGGQTKGRADSIRKNAGFPTPPNFDAWSSTPEYFGLEGAAVQAVQTPNRWFTVRRLDGSDTGVSYIRVGDALYCQVPSGGLITYHRPRLERSDKSWRGLSLSFEGWNTNPKYGPIGWVRLRTHGGKLCENVVQKTARDIQMGAIHRLERSGRYPVVMHTYDEDVCEVPIDGGRSVEELESIMVDVQSWARSWPIKAAGGWMDPRYRKG